MTGFVTCGSWIKRQHLPIEALTSTHLVLIGTSFDEQDLQIGISPREPSSGDTSCGATTCEDDVHLPHALGIVDR
jgi:hypothetical protein